MPMYLWQVHYGEAGAQGLLEEGGTRRREAITAMVESVGGRVHACYFGLADHDLFVIGEVPDEIAAVALRIETAASGAAHSQAIPLLSAEDVDEAISRRVAYRAPGSSSDA